MTNNKMTDNAAFYAPLFKAWPKGLGDKPTEKQMSDAFWLGCARGKQHITIAMALREKGVTSAQIIEAVALYNVTYGEFNRDGTQRGAPQNNKRKGLIDDGHLIEVVLPPIGKLQVYACKVSPKGLQRIESQAKAHGALIAKANTVEKPAKPKAEKPKAAKRAGKPASALNVVEATNTAPAAENAPVSPASPANTTLPVVLPLTDGQAEGNLVK